MHPKPATSSLWDRYVKLRPEQKLALRLKSLIAETTTRTDFLDCLKATGQRAPDGKTWTFVSADAVLAGLRAQGLLTDALTCLPLLRHPVALDAMADRDNQRLADAVTAIFPPRGRGFHYATFHEANLKRLLRLAVYRNDAQTFATYQALSVQNFGIPPIHLVANLFFGDDLKATWIAQRDPVIRASLLAAVLFITLATGNAGTDLPAIIVLARKELAQPGFEIAALLLVRYDLLSGRLDHVRAALDGTAGDIRQALEADIAYLEGRNEDALKLYREALKAYRKRMGRRKILLPDEHGLFFLMALLRTNDPTLHSEIQSALDAAMSGQDIEADSAMAAMQALLWLVQGQQSKARALLKRVQEHPAPIPMSQACVALAAHQVDPALLDETDLDQRFEQVRDVLPLVARIYAELLAKTAKHPGPYRAWCKQAASALTKIELTDLVQQRQAWERALESLDAFLGAGTANAETAAPPKAKRLAWFVDPVTETVSVAEQSTKGRDGWTDGRAVAMKRLHEQDPRLDYLLPQDRQALRAIRKLSGGWYNDDEYEFDHPRAIAALVGHPAVFDARHRAQPIELVAYPLELVVTETAGGYRIALSHTAEAATVFLEAETPTRYRVVEFPATMIALQGILGERGLTVPAAGRDQVVAMARRSNPKLPIRAEIADIAQPGIEAESTPVVQLVPYEHGLKLTILVRPFGPNGPAYVAGLGGRSVLATIDGQQVRANRDQPRELAERAALVEACPTLRDRGSAESHEVLIEDLEGSLDVLLELRAYAGPLAMEWPEGHVLRVTPLEPSKMKMRVSGDRDWFSVDGSATLDDDQVLEMRFLLDRLDKAQGRFVPLGDGRFVALTRQMQTQLERLAAVSEPHKNGRRVHALGAPALDAVLEDAGQVSTDAIWKKAVARIRAAGDWTPTLPPTLQADLRDYQVEGFVWMSRLARWGAGACLADDMGLGKTVQAIAVMLARAAEGPCLVVAPTSVCPNWEHEIARFAPTLRTHRLPVTGNRAGLIAGIGPHDVLICTYGLLHQTAEALGARTWNMVVLDEAQAIKNADTKRARAVHALQADFRLALTGTPIENYLDELWSLFSFVNPGVLGTRDRFQKSFAGPIERAKNPHARHALRALIRPFLLRRTKAAVLSELPPRTEQTINVEMSDTERAFYEALRQKSLERIAALDGPVGRRKMQILAEITRLRRACCNPALIDAAASVPSGKLTACMELVEDLIRNRHRALVFSQFVGHLDLVRAALDARGISYQYLDGGTPSAERERRVAAFQSGSSDLFLISLRAGGTGLNLTAADYVVHLDPWWNPAVEDQASDRAHRIGQERPVTIYRLIMQDSIEERILALHRDKRDLASDLLDGTETTARLSEEALLDLIRV